MRLQNVWETWLRNNVSSSLFSGLNPALTVCIQFEVSTSFIAQETWPGNNVSWFIHLLETWLGNNVSWFSQVFEHPSRQGLACLEWDCQMFGKHS
jgi:hypothetical protein